MRNTGGEVSENGILGMGPTPALGLEEFDLIHAGKQLVTLFPVPPSSIMTTRLR